jgi:hypothetical protein
MPHRLAHIQLALVQGFEFLGLSIAAIMASVNGILDETSWDRLTGRHGALFFMAIALIIFWNSGRLREKREQKNMLLAEAREIKRREHEEKMRIEENKAREDRHKEAIALQAANAEKLAALAAESIKAQALVAAAIEGLKDELESRPCGIKQKQQT